MSDRSRERAPGEARPELEPVVREGYESAKPAERQGDGDPRPKDVAEDTPRRGTGGTAVS